MIVNRLLLAALICSSAGFGAGFGAAGEARAQAAMPALVQTGPLSFAPLVRRVVPAVVNIGVRMSVSDQAAANDMPPELKGTPFEKTFRDHLKNRPEQMIGAGSGFILDPSGIIVTNNHVVGNADKITVVLTDGSELHAHLLGTDELTDIAVIKVEAGHPLPFVGWGDSRAVQVGDWIMAAGNPFGLGGSVTAGIVSARGRDIGAGPFDDFFQLDAPINPGNSGGPTFNMAGQVIALNTAIVSPTGGSVGIGFAIPSEIASRIVDELLSKGRVDRGWLGVEVDTDTASHRKSGAAIASVDHGGPAARAGMKAGDVVVSINGDRVDNPRQLIRAVSSVNPGGVARLRIRRSNQMLELTVTVARRPPEPPPADDVQQ
jgi:serine protease Do